MLAQAFAQRLSRAGVHYGWMVVAVISPIVVAVTIWQIGGRLGARQRQVEASA